MLLYSFPALVTPFPAKVFNIKGAAINVKNLPSFSFPPIMTHFPVITFINEEVTGCINKEAIGAINEAVMGAIMDQEIHLHVLYFVFYCFSHTIN